MTTSELVESEISSFAVTSGIPEDLQIPIFKETMVRDAAISAN